MNMLQFNKKVCI